MTNKEVQIEENADGNVVSFECQESDGLSSVTVQITLGDYDDAHLMAELVRRSRSVSIKHPS